MTALRALIFDFDGIIADTEPLHFGALTAVLRELSIPLTATEYYTEYLGYDDKGCFLTALRTHGREASPALIADLIGQKSERYLDMVRDHVVIFPGVSEFVRHAAEHYPLAIASGGLRHEIELILEHAGLRKEFGHITSAEDVVAGKPSPEPFLHALAGLNRGHPEAVIAPEDCLAIEDSVPGLRAAHAAGMKTLAVANTHDVSILREADAITHSLAQTSLDDLRDRLWRTPDGLT